MGGHAVLFDVSNLGPFCHRVLVPDSFGSEVTNLIINRFLSPLGEEFWGTSWNNLGHQAEEFGGGLFQWPVASAINQVILGGVA